MFNPLRAISGAFSRGIKSTFPELEAGRMARRLSNWTPSRAHVNTLIGASGKTVLARARYLVRNNGYAFGATECFAGNLIGTGITPEWALDDRLAGDTDDKKQAIETCWSDWTDECDAEGITDFYGLQRRVARELFIAGECFIRRRPRFVTDDLAVPVQLELLPSEQLPTERNLWLENGNRIRQGIEYNQNNQRVAYHFWKVHPGDVTQSPNFGKIVIVPAEDILHIHDPVESGQIRGLPRLTPTIVALWMLDAYDDAELERKKTAALFSVFIKRQDPTPTFLDRIVEQAAEDTLTGAVTVDLQPGVAHQLLPGEDVTVAAPAEVGTSYDHFQYRTLTKFCAAVGLPYTGVTGDMTMANYGSMRGAMLEIRRRLDALQHSVIVYQMCRPVSRWFLDAAALSGALTLPGYARLQPGAGANGACRRDYQRITWTPPKWDWIDPLKDVQAEVIAINAGITSRSAVVRGQGMDPVKNDQDIADDADRAEELGIVFVGSVGKSQELASPPGASDSGAAVPGSPDDESASATNGANAKPGGARGNGAAKGKGNGAANNDKAVVKAAFEMLSNMKPPIVNVTVPGRKGVEVTTVTKHDDEGRILEYQRQEIEADNGHHKRELN